MKKDPTQKFCSKPETKIAWWAMSLGLLSVLLVPLLNLFVAVIRPMIDRAGGETTGAVVGFGLGSFSIPLCVTALIVGIAAYKKGERSWILWLGFIPALLSALFWLLMIIGEILFPH